MHMQRVSTMPLFEGEGLGDETTGRPSPNVSECGSCEEIAMRVPNAGNICVHSIHEVHQCLKQADADYYYQSVVTSEF